MSPIPAVLVLALAGCGGGGGGGGGPTPPQETAPSLLLGDIDLPPGATTGDLDVALAGESPFPVMVQFDLVVDSGQLTLDPTVIQLQALGRVETHRVVPGRLRVVCGDATGRPGQPLPAGALVRVPVALASGAGPGPFTVRLEAIVASDGAGNAPSFDAAPRTAEVRRN